MTDNSEPDADISILFGTEAILRSLILFNGLFAVQTVLALVYLWGNAKLPDGISYAGYAHRGAYPLIATALLSAAFVLAAMRVVGQNGEAAGGERSGNGPVVAAFQGVSRELDPDIASHQIAQQSWA